MLCGIEVAAAIAGIINGTIGLGHLIARAFTHCFGQKNSRRDSYYTPYSRSYSPPPAYSSPSTSTNRNSGWTTGQVVAVGLGSTVAGGVVACAFGPVGLALFCLGAAGGALIASC
jgi:hypothetical protein